MAIVAESRSGALAVALLCLGASACNAISDPGIEYVCFPPAMPYEEHFNGKYGALTDACWEPKGANKGDIAIGESDLVVGHETAVSWDASPPRFVQRLEGDFVMVTKVEAISGSHSNFCFMKPDDAAGLIVTGGLVDSAFLVRPYLEESPDITCEDESDNPPKAIVEAFSTGRPFDPTKDQSPGIGIDGEGDIAVCRNSGSLSYYFRQSDDPEGPWMPGTGEWKQLDRADVVGDGPLDVGIGTTLGQEGAEAGLSVEGHFNWVFLTDSGDDCSSPLESLPEPEPE